MSNSWSLLGLCGPRSRKQFGNAAFLIVLLHNSHRHITAEMLSTTFPQEITHKRVLKDCDEEFKVFLTTMEALGEKLGPLLFQFGKFDKYAFKSLDDSREASSVSEKASEGASLPSRFATRTGWFLHSQMCCESMASLSR